MVKMKNITLNDLGLLLNSLDNPVEIRLNLKILEDILPNGHPGHRFNIFSLVYKKEWIEDILAASTEYTIFDKEQRFVSEQTHLNLLAQIYFRTQLIKQLGKKPLIYNPKDEPVDFDTNLCSLYLGDRFKPLLNVSKEEMIKLIESNIITCEPYTVMSLSSQERDVIKPSIKD